MGPGPAGPATATLLAERGCRVALLHGDTVATRPLGESLSAAAAGLLARLGVWERFRVGPHRPVHARASAWGGDLVEQSAIFDPYGPGWLIDRSAFEELLRERSREAGAQVLTGRVVGCRAEERGAWRLALADGTDLVERAIVDATGRSCWVAKAIGGHCEVHDRMSALVAHHVPVDASPVGPPVLVEATSSGWWYSAFVPSGAVVALFFTETGIARVDDLAAAWAEALAAAPHTRARLQGAHGTRLPEIRPVTVQRAVLPPTATACFVVGDAAVGLDPLSSAGLRVGLETASEAADAVTAALEGDRSSSGAYSIWVGGLLDAHLAERASYYGLEKRWSAAPFWATRRTRGLGTALRSAVAPAEREVVSP